MKKKRSKILKSDSKYHPLISVTNVIELNFFFQIAFLKNCYLITKELSVLRQHIFYFDNFNTNWSSNRIRRGICGKRWKLQEMMVFLSPIKLYKILTHCHSALRSGGWLMENGSGGGGGLSEGERWLTRNFPTVHLNIVWITSLAAKCVWHHEWNTIPEQREEEEGPFIKRQPQPVYQIRATKGFNIYG